MGKFNFICTECSIVGFRICLDWSLTVIGCLLWGLGTSELVQSLVALNPDVYVTHVNPLANRYVITVLNVAHLILLSRYRRQ